MNSFGLILLILIGSYIAITIGIGVFIYVRSGSGIGPPRPRPRPADDISGVQPTDKLDTSKPPQGGSGVKQKDISEISFNHLEVENIISEYLGYDEPNHETLTNLHHETLTNILRKEFFKRQARGELNDS